MIATFSHYALAFLRPARTSRAVMTVKDTYFLRVYDPVDPSRYGVGECALFKGLGCDDRPGYTDMLEKVCRDIAAGRTTDLTEWPSIKFGLETALRDYDNGCCRWPFPTPWSMGQGGILINGLVWMDTPDIMLQNAILKAEAGFRCIKIKIGAYDFDCELRMLDRFRRLYGPEKIELRLDANGAFAGIDDAIDRLRRLAPLDIHSIEQPIRAGRWEEMGALCASSPIPVALDEELIGVNSSDRKQDMLRTIRPSYIILKPSLCGGFSGSDEWISLARANNIGWWATSALESNVGLNAIAQWTSSLNTTIPQGLGTGQLYANNIDSPLRLDGQLLRYDPSVKFGI